MVGVLRERDQDVVQEGEEGRREADHFPGCMVLVFVADTRVRSIVWCAWRGVSLLESESRARFSSWLLSANSRCRSGDVLLLIQCD